MMPSLNYYLPLFGRYSTWGRPGRQAALMQRICMNSLFSESTADYSVLMAAIMMY
jgi:hypothetical protein